MAFAATADGKRVYVTDSVYNIVSIIYTITNTVIATIPVGIFPYGDTVTPNGKKVYVTNRKEKIVGQLFSYQKVFEVLSSWRGMGIYTFNRC